MDLTRTGYRPNPETIQALKSLMAQKGSGARALLVTGEAGTGKTALAEAIADALDAHDRYYYVQLHSWTDGKRFFDYQSGSGTEEKGFLTKVAEASQVSAQIWEQHRSEFAVSSPSDGVPPEQWGWTVACLDEMDKAPESFEALFLDWLQTGRVPGKPGEHLYTDLDHLVVIVTSNGMREHTEPFMRRCRRLRMERMSRSLAVELLLTRTQTSERACDLTVGLAHACERVDETVLSLQEMTHFLNEARHVCNSLDDLKAATVAWLMRRDEPENILRSFEVQRILPQLWTEIERLQNEARQELVPCC
ncbi:MAG: AAA family ATPase [Acidithiobacillus sp.]|jgi:MoxR-like ATPase|nr:AAA family ATPase [Acidithiobacillus sp.]